MQAKCPTHGAWSKDVSLCHKNNEGKVVTYTFWCNGGHTFLATPEHIESLIEQPPEGEQWMNSDVTEPERTPDDTGGYYEVVDPYTGEPL